MILRFVIICSILYGFQEDIQRKDYHRFAVKMIGVAGFIAYVLLGERK